MGKFRVFSRMKNLLTHSYTILIFRIILGIIFIYASLDKIQNPSDFSDTIDNFHISPIAISSIIALILPWIELFTGICLIIGVFLPGASLITIGLYILFIFVLSQAVVRGIDTHCGCFKVTAEIQSADFKTILIKRILEDIILLCMAFVVFQNIPNLLSSKIQEK